MLAANAMDFDDLLVRTVNALELFEEVRERWRRTFRHVLVDEYQDTNHAQYRLLQLLCAEHGNLMVVGDEDQCLVEGTLVKMGDGSEKPIEELCVGDMVASCHGTLTSPRSGERCLQSQREQRRVDQDPRGPPDHQHSRAHALCRVSPRHYSPNASRIPDVEARSRVPSRGLRGLHPARQISCRNSPALPA